MNLDGLRVISVDPSLRSTGLYCNWKDSSETISCKSASHVGALFHLGNVLSSRCIGADAMLVEDYAYGKAGMSKSLTSMGEVRGVITYIAKKENVSIFPVPIQTWKSRVPKLPRKVNTKSGLMEYARCASEAYHRPFATPDEADAFMMFDAVRTLLQVEPTHKLSVLMTEILLGGLQFVSE